MTITATHGKYIEVVFLEEKFFLGDFGTQCKGDFNRLEFYDGGNMSQCLLAKACGQDKPEPIFSTSNELTLNFHRNRRAAYPNRASCLDCKLYIKFKGK